MKVLAALSRLALPGALATAFLAVAASAAFASGPALSLRVTVPDTVTAGEQVKIQIVATNVGDQPLSGDLTLADTFPAGIAPTNPLEGTSCSIVGQTSTCTIPAAGVLPGGQVRGSILASVDPGASGRLVNAVEVSGGGAAGTLDDQETMTVGPPLPFALRTFAVTALDSSGAPVLPAGGDPAALTTSLGVPTMAFDFTGIETTAPVEHFKDVTVHLPPGLVGNPTATPARCTSAQLAEMSPFGHAEIPECPQDSQVGIATILGGDQVPIYNMVPPLGYPAAFGFEYESSTVLLFAKLRSSDDGIDIVARNTTTSVPVPAVDVTMWGVPADSSHDDLRHTCLDGYQGNNGNVCPSTAPRAAFLRLPTSCVGTPLPWSVDMNSYEHPGTFVGGDTTTPALTGCDLNPFGPSLQLTPTNAVPGAATGLDATLSMPQSTDPAQLAEADLRTATVTLPQGMALNPAAADGLQACPDADLPFGRDGAASCPDASKIGTVTLRTPLLDHAVGGSVFLRTQNGDDPTSGQLFRIAVEIRSDDDGIDIKLPASIRADPVTGQVTTTFDDLPQLPFSSMLLHFKEGPRAPLVAPRVCGTNDATTQFVSWGDRLVTPPSSFDLSGDGHGGACSTQVFSPTLRQVTEHPVAGASTAFHVLLKRGDADQPFQSVRVDTPAGLLGRIKSAQLCPDAAASADTCPAGSQIGRATVGAGAGNPFYLTNGRVYLTGPYKGAPYGMAIAVHALAGPFDLGTVIVRSAIQIDSRTAALHVVSDPFPATIKGVPPDLRDVRISIDKPGFMVNPTSCAAKTVGGTAIALDGETAALSSPFRVGGCGRLRFSPRMSMRVGSRGHTGVRHSAPLSTTIVQSAGQANLKRVKVTLPATLDALLPVVAHACTLAQYQANDCARARAGSAVAVTPLLKNPLRGGAYFVKHPGRGLPDLRIALRGDVSLDLVGRISIRHNTQLVTDFDTIPDAPVTRFTLNIVAGRNGPIGVVTNLCSKKARNATVAISMVAQNGASISKRQRLRIGGCPAATKRRHR